MSHSHETERIRFWRARAEELRTTASEFKDPTAKKGLLDAADSYDEMADRSESEIQLKKDPSNLVPPRSSKPHPSGLQ